MEEFKAIELVCSPTNGKVRCYSAEGEKTLVDDVKILGRDGGTITLERRGAFTAYSPNRPLTCEVKEIFVETYGRRQRKEILVCREEGVPRSRLEQVK